MRVQLGVCYGRKGAFEIGDALGDVGSDRLGAGRVGGCRQKQARACLPFVARVPARLLIAFVAEPPHEPGDHGVRYLRKLG